MVSLSRRQSNTPYYAQNDYQSSKVTAESLEFTRNIIYSLIDCSPGFHLPEKNVQTGSFRYNNRKMFRYPTESETSHSNDEMK